ncbi:ammonium transporter, partial [Salmonella enterica subsp. enterica serovar Typhimurium]
LRVVYGYLLVLGEGNHFFGNAVGAMLKNIAFTAVTGTIYQYIYVAFLGSFACITVGLFVGALAECIRFSSVLIFV